MIFVLVEILLVEVYTDNFTAQKLDAVKYGKLDYFIIIYLP